MKQVRFIDVINAIESSPPNIDLLDILNMYTSPNYSFVIFAAKDLKIGLIYKTIIDLYTYLNLTNANLKDARRSLRHQQNSGFMKDLRLVLNLINVATVKQFFLEVMV